MIGFLTVPYDPIFSMFGHSNLIIWVLPIYLYIITFFLANVCVIYVEKKTLFYHRPFYNGLQVKKGFAY